MQGFTDPLVDCRTCKLRFRADQLDGRAVRQQAEQAPRRDARLRPDRGAAVQPHVQDARRSGRGDGHRRLPSARDRAGHLHQLQERRCSSRAASRRSASRRSASRSATRSRRATSSSACASSSRWRWSSSCRRTAADAVVPLLGRRRGSTGTLDLGAAREPSAHPRARRRRALALLERDERHRVPLPDRLVRARGRREPRRLRPDAAHRALRDEARVRRPRHRRAVRPARDRAGARARPAIAGVHRRRVRRGGRR